MQYSLILSGFIKLYSSEQHVTTVLIRWYASDLEFQFSFFGSLTWDSSKRQLLNNGTSSAVVKQIVLLVVVFATLQSFHSGKRIKSDEGLFLITCS